MASLRVEEFLTKFGLPMVAGGDLHVGAPIAPPTLVSWAVAMDAASRETVAIDDARTGVLQRLVAKPPTLLLDPDDVALLVALHNALYLVHPQAKSFLVSDRVRRRVIDSSLNIASVGLAITAQQALARHGLLHQLFVVRRRDVTVRWWTGSATFFGQQPPARLVAWEGLRRVQQNVTEVPFLQLLGQPETVPIVATVARRSPLTQLLAAVPGGPLLHWEDAVFLLREPVLARVIAHELAEGGAASLPQLLAAAAAFEQMLERSPAAADVKAVAALLIYIEALMCLDEGAQLQRERSPQMTRLLTVNPSGGRERGAALFAALPAALASVAPAIAQPPWLRGNAAAWMRWEVRRTQVAATLEAAVIEGLAARLGRRLNVGAHVTTRPAAAQATPSGPR